MKKHDWRLLDRWGRTVPRKEQARIEAELKKAKEEEKRAAAKKKK